MRAFAGLYDPAVQCESALLANRGVIGPDQLLYLEGAGWEHVTASAFPWTVTGCLSGLFHFDEGESGTTHAVRMSVVDQDGNDLGASAALLVTATSRLLTFAVPFSIIVTEVGWFEVKLSDLAGVFSSTRCDVVLQAATSE